MNLKDITEIADEKYIYLTTIGRKTGNPYTVELWFAHARNNIYLSHEGTYTDWMRNIIKNAWVKFRIGGLQFKAKARIVKNGGAFEQGKKALYNKYYGKTSQDVIDDWFSESTVIELSMIKREHRKAS